MSRLALKQFVKDQLDGIRGAPVPIDSYTQRPRQTPIGASAVVVVDLREGRESRLTMPRGVGQKQNKVTARLDVYWVAQDDHDSGESFDQLLDALDSALRSAPIPSTITDPVTLTTSQVVFIGEEIETHVEEPLLDESIEGLVVFGATKHLAILEVYQG